MPTYDYQCRACGTVTEVIHSMQEDGPSVCELCGGELRRVLFPSGIIFKGSGFYRNDSRASSSSSTAEIRDERPGPARAMGAGPEKKLRVHDRGRWLIGVDDRPDRLELDLGRLRLARAASAAEARIRREGQAALATALNADVAGSACDLARRCLPERALQRGQAGELSLADGRSTRPIRNLRAVRRDRALARIAEPEEVELRAARGKLGGVGNGGRALVLDRRGLGARASREVEDRVGDRREPSRRGSALRLFGDRLRLGLDLGHHRLRLGLDLGHDRLRLGLDLGRHAARRLGCDLGRNRLRLGLGRDWLRLGLRLGSNRLGFGSANSSGSGTIGSGSTTW